MKSRFSGEKFLSCSLLRSRKNELAEEKFNTLGGCGHVGTVSQNLLQFYLRLIVNNLHIFNDERWTCTFKRQLMFAVSLQQPVAKYYFSLKTWLWTRAEDKCYETSSIMTSINAKNK